ncbi:Monoterpene epsilon-lactone hydrolase (plasmid) [Sphingobium sp. AntQ-1]|uniref:alpha/beta hydrolase n=1 Tax=Sphingobium sp. AntQ-1 TaxID=2930091 RepID=UPI00234EE8AC|nr:alpha/beta hydrolase [Sphingobium sp. AntQ-1]WCP15988.1 Monoterpene epsilon-lactone hydrolase [Sphingobium sp. AntQ-1]
MTEITKEADFLRELYQEWTDRSIADPNMSLAAMRSMFDEWGKPTFEPEGVTYRSDDLGGCSALWALPVDADATRVALYFHGGGFAVGSADSHRKLVGHLAKALGITAVALDYRRSPEHPFPSQIEDSIAAYRALLARGFKPANILTAGDSAGANLAISTVMKLRDLDLPLPGAVVAISPWLDMALRGNTIEKNEATDALVKMPVLQAMSAMFLNGADPLDPLANPLENDFTDFPPLYINAGSLETLLSDSETLRDRVHAAGRNVTLTIVEGMQHVFPALAGRAAEANEEFARMGSWFRNLSSD